MSSKNFNFIKESKTEKSKIKEFSNSRNYDFKPIISPIYGLSEAKKNDDGEYGVIRPDFTKLENEKVISLEKNVVYASTAESSIVEKITTQSNEVQDDKYSNFPKQVQRPSNLEADIYTPAVTEKVEPLNNNDIFEELKKLKKVENKFKHVNQMELDLFGEPKE